MLKHSNITNQIIKISYEKGQLEATIYLLNEYNLLSENVILAIRPNAENPKNLVLTTEGDFGKDAIQTIKIPENLFDFPMEMVINMLAHEIMHVHQKTGDEIVEEKNEREFQAYYEGVFQNIYNHLPISPVWLKNQFAHQALRYFNAMGENSTLQQKYMSQKALITLFLEENKASI